MGFFSRGPILIVRFLRRAVTAAGTILAAGALFALAGAVESIHPGWAEAHSAGSPALARISLGDTVARLSVPRLGFEAAVREGVDEATLSFGPGHVPGTALPGEESRRKNAVIAIARDVGTPFASDLALGDVIELRTPFGLRSYRVVERRILRIEEVSIAPTEEPSLTLLSSYPPDSIGPAPLRLAVRAEPFEPALANARTRSATRSTGWISTLAALGVSTALPEGR
jgi:LPXTG-site transpeptidase (sortase) family protein